jgi:hypothetical protein
VYQDAFFPLRTIAGRAVRLAQNAAKQPDVVLLEESATSRDVDIQYAWKLKASLAGTVADPLYERYLPVLELSATPGGAPEIVQPGPGMDTVPIPRERPFSAQEPVLSLFALSKRFKDKNVSRDLSATFRVRLAAPTLIGGICFGGMPHIPYTLSKAGESSSNFGVPREVRLTCVSTTSDDRTASTNVAFVDADLSLTKQEFISHSAFHYLCTEPAWTDTILLRFSDYPSFAARVASDDIQADMRATKERWGFVLPYFYVFEYQEGTRYRPIVPGGLVGIRDSFTTHPPSGGDISRSSLVDYSLLVSAGGGRRYISFTGGSVFGQGRTFSGVAPVGEDNPKPRDLKECFISHKVPPGGRLTIYLQQSEEYSRCVAGIKLLLPFVPKDAPGGAAPDITAAGDDQLQQYLTTALGVPRSIAFCRKIGVRVFEVDPLDGVSPPLVALDSKFATLLAEREIDTLSEIVLTRALEGILFTRASSSQHFAIELTNREDRAAQFVVHDLDFIQSAHVTLHPRASRTQQVRALNFRILGADLSDDYAALGPTGFTFTIERVVAGERKSVLLRANSLLDLLHMGAAKLFANARRRAVEFEKSEIYPAFDGEEAKYLVPGEYTGIGTPRFAANYEDRFTRARSEGWRRAETGSGVLPRKKWDTRPDRPFRSYMNQTVRTKNELIYPDATFFDRVRTFYEKVSDKAGKRNWIPDEEDVPELWVDSGVWRGVSKSALRIRGVTSVSASPVGFLKRSHVDNSLEQALDKLTSAGLHFTGGSSSSLSAGIGIISSTLAVNPYPTVQHQATYGTQGSITRQGADTGYSYSQHLNEGYDEGDGYTEVRGGEMKRVVTRRDVPDTDAQRTKGAEVMWQGRLVDIVTGSIPLNFTLPATAGNRYMRTADDSLRIRFSNGVRRAISVDFWFDLTEEVVRDDY